MQAVYPTFVSSSTFFSLAHLDSIQTFLFLNQRFTKLSAMGRVKDKGKNPRLSIVDFPSSIASAFAVPDGESTPRASTSTRYTEVSGRSNYSASTSTFQTFSTIDYADVDVTRVAATATAAVERSTQARSRWAREDGADVRMPTASRLSYIAGTDMYGEDRPSGSRVYDDRDRPGGLRLGIAPSGGETLWLEPLWIDGDYRQYGSARRNLAADRESRIREMDGDADGATVYPVSEEFKAAMQQALSVERDVIQPTLRNGLAMSGNEIRRIDQTIHLDTLNDTGITTEKETPVYDPSSSSLQDIVATTENAAPSSIQPSLAAKSRIQSRDRPVTLQEHYAFLDFYVLPYLPFLSDPQLDPESILDQFAMQINKKSEWSRWPPRTPRPPNIDDNDDEDEDEARYFRLRFSSTIRLKVEQRILNLSPTFDISELDSSLLCLEIMGRVLIHMIGRIPILYSSMEWADYLMTLEKELQLLWQTADDDRIKRYRHAWNIDTDAHVEREHGSTLSGPVAVQEAKPAIAHTQFREQAVTLKEHYTFLDSEVIPHLPYINDPQLDPEDAIERFDIEIVRSSKWHRFLPLSPIIYTNKKSYFTLRFNATVRPKLEELLQALSPDFDVTLLDSSLLCLDVAGRILVHMRGRTPKRKAKTDWEDYLKTSGEEMEFVWRIYGREQDRILKYLHAWNIVEEDVDAVAEETEIEADVSDLHQVTDLGHQITVLKPFLANSEELPTAATAPMVADDEAERSSLGQTATDRSNSAAEPVTFYPQALYKNITG